MVSIHIIIVTRKELNRLIWFINTVNSSKLYNLRFKIYNFALNGELFYVVIEVVEFEKSKFIMMKQFVIDLLYSFAESIKLFMMVF